MRHICMCQDSSGAPHGVPISNKEFKDDGMCPACADHVWTEMNSTTEYTWRHQPIEQTKQ